MVKFIKFLHKWVYLNQWFGAWRLVFDLARRGSIIGFIYSFTQ